MDQHMVTHRRLGHEGKVDLLGETAEIDAPDPHDRHIAGNAEDPSRNR
jgi:hypothetical protein